MVEQERATKDMDANTIDTDTIEVMIDEIGVIIETGKELKVTISMSELPYGPILTSAVTGQENGYDLLRILINEGYHYYSNR